ncbi:Calx-beta domain-containing protein, partial [Microcoleus sp. B3-D3]
DGDSEPKTVLIPIGKDTVVEGDETVNLSLVSPTGSASIGTPDMAILTIVDDDSTLEFSDPTFSVIEDEGVVEVTVTRTGIPTGAVSATVNLTDGTATAAVDYDGTPIVVNFADGDSEPKTVLIPIGKDTVVEGDETVSLTLDSATGATIGELSTATLNIVDDDSTLEFSAPTFSVNEDGTTIAAVTVTRTGSTTGAASATVNLSDGTAVAPGDYTNEPIVVNFAAGDSTPQTITIPIANDTVVENEETVNLSLAIATGATIGRQSTAILNIVDNDGAATPLDPLSAASIVNDPLTDFRSASAIGGIGLLDSSLLGGSALPTVDMSNFITNYFNGVAIANPSVTVNATQNLWDLYIKPIVGGLDQNPIAGAGTASRSFNPLF